MSLIISNRPLIRIIVIELAYKLQNCMCFIRSNCNHGRELLCIVDYYRRHVIVYNNSC